MWNRDVRRRTPISAGQSFVFNEPGSTAAYLVDGSIADVTVRGEQVTIVGRRPGTTHLVIVTVAGVVMHECVVMPVISRSAENRPAAATTTTSTGWESSYNSGSSQLTSALTVSRRSQATALDLRMSHIARLEPDGTTPSARTAIPSFEFRAEEIGRHVISVGDARLNGSSLTLPGVALRGVQYTGRRVELLAGQTVPPLFGSVPRAGGEEHVAGIVVPRLFGKAAVKPGLFYLVPVSGSEGQPGDGRRGAFASIQYQHGKRTDAVWLRSEIGYGRRLGAAVDLITPGVRFHA